MYVPDSVNHLSEFLPRPDDVQEKEGRIGAQVVINRDLVDRYPAIIQKTWNDLYQKLLAHISVKMMGREEYFVIKFHPLVRDGWETRYYEDAYALQLTADVMVAQGKNIVIPTIVYDRTDYSVPRKIIEWRCGYCSSPNRMEERHCTQCGSPRALLIQEMQ